jgi:hypothetical protein
MMDLWHGSLAGGLPGRPNCFQGLFKARSCQVAIEQRLVLEWERFITRAFGNSARLA